MNIITESNFYLTELIFLKRDTNIYFEYITLFEKKRVLLRKIFVKIIDVFFLKIYFFSKKFCYI